MFEFDVCGNCKSHPSFPLFKQRRGSNLSKLSMACCSPRLFSSFLAGDSVASRFQSFAIFQLNACSSPGHIHKSKHLFTVSRKLSGLADLLFNRRGHDQEQSEGQLKCNSLKPGKVSPRLPVPEHISKPPYANSRRQPDFVNEPQRHNAEGIACMRASGQLAACVLEYAGTLVKPGVTTDEIDKAVHAMIIDAGAYPSPLGYGGFPKSVCTSVNECICHGIPDSRMLEDGDIINIDVTVYLNGYHGDTSKTFFCGNVDEQANQLVKVTEECLYKAIAICGPRVEFKRIGQTINEHADKFHYGIVRQFVGHGVGKIFHSDPVIFHFRNNQPGRMVVGQTFTIEPMLTIGSIEPVMWKDNWTVVTADGSLSAQFEHTLLITESGVDILTQC